MGQVEPLLQTQMDGDTRAGDGGIVGTERHMPELKQGAIGGRVVPMEQMEKMSNVGITIGPRRLRNYTTWGCHCNLFSLYEIAVILSQRTLLIKCTPLQEYFTILYPHSVISELPALHSHYSC